MRFIDRLNFGFKKSFCALWLLFVPVVVDLAGLIYYVYFLKNSYIVPDKIFIIKFGTISSPPSVSYILENFPSLLFKFSSSYGALGVISEISIFNILLLLTLMVFLTFLKSGYLSCLERVGYEHVTFFYFLRAGNSNWHRFFILDCIFVLPMVLLFISYSWLPLNIVLSGLSVLFYYVQYSIVVDSGTLRDNFRLGIKALTANFGFTIKMALYYGFLISLSSIIVYPISKAHTIGVIVSILLIDFMGMGTNKAVLETYRELKFVKKNTPTIELQEESDQNQTPDSIDL